MGYKFVCVAVLVSISLGVESCADNPTESSSTSRPPDRTDPITTTNDGDWNIPIEEIISGGVTKDGIPSLFNPATIPAEQADYLDDDDLVVGILINGEPRAYPHTILDWHEVVNERIAGELLTVSYCPLTGTAIVFDGKLPSAKLVFGVSGLLYNNNLIMFDRETNSHWPQMRLQCDEGPLRNTKQIVYPAIETSWGSWKKLYPNTVILSPNTSFSRPYDRPGTAYPDYNLLHSRPLYQMREIDNRLPTKQRVHGVLTGQGPDNYTSKVYPINKEQEPHLIHDTVGGQDILVVDAGEQNFVVAYNRVVGDNSLVFEIEEREGTFPFSFQDKGTNSTWTVLGEAIAGPLAGTKLERPLSFNAYWFAWAAFYENTEIYDD